MSEKKTPKNKNIISTSEANVDKPNIRLVEGKRKNEFFLSPTSDTLIKVRFTGHHLKWSWQVIGTTKRAPSKTVKMRHWNKYIYSFKGATIVLNPNTFELWLRSRHYKPTKNASGVARMIYANWSKADRLSREFSEFAQIALQPIHTEHPADIEKAHLVMTTKELNPILKPLSEVKDEVGLIFDKSHPGKPEFTGEKSVEGAQGAEWFFTKFPNQFGEFTRSIMEYSDQLQLHLEVERETLKTMKTIRKSLERKKRAGTQG